MAAAHPHPPPRTADSTTNSSRQGSGGGRGGRRYQSKDRNLSAKHTAREVEVKKQFEAILADQDADLKVHMEKANLRRGEVKEKKIESAMRWRRKASSARKSRMEASANKVAALEAKVDFDDEYLATAAKLADEHVQTKRAHNHALRTQYFERRLVKDEEEDLKTIESLCMKHKFFLPSARVSQGGACFSPNRTQTSASSTRRSSDGEKTRRITAGPPSASLRQPLFKTTEGLPSLLKAMDEPRQRAYDKRLEEKKESMLAHREEKAIKQEVVQRRVKDLIFEAAERVKGDLKRKEAACVRVAKLMELKRNPRRAKAIERLVQSNPELWGPGE